MLNLKISELITQFLNYAFQGAKAQDNQNVLIPMGTGETLNVPLGGDENAAAHLDDEQVQRLEELQRSLANMLKMRKEADNLSG